MLSRRRERQVAESMRRRRLEEDYDDHNTEAEHQNLRRNLGFMRYAEENRRSSQTMDRTREHARQIAMALSKDETSPFAADFNNAFGGDPFAVGFPTEETESTTHTDFDFFGNRDPFASLAETERSSDPGSTTVIRRSAWNASPVTKKAPSRTRTPQRQKQQEQQQPLQSHNATPNRPAEDSSVASSRNSAATPGANAKAPSAAAARRKMRTNMRQKEQQQTTPQKGSSSVSSSSHHRKSIATPPQMSTPTTPVTDTPQQQRSTPLYSTPPPSQQQRSTPLQSTPPQQIPISNHLHQHHRPTRRKNEHHQQQQQPDRSTDHLFDIQKTAGFSFDAFGLDGAEMQKRVHQAMDEIGWDDDEFAPQNWSSHASDDDENHHSTSIHLEESPEKISERSSLTDSAAEPGNVNMFKEQPGYHKPRKVVRPSLEFFDQHQPSLASALEGKASVRTESTAATTTTGDVGKLRSRWEAQTASPPPITASKKEPPQKLKQSHINRLQNQLGDDILSPEKLLNYAATQESSDRPDISFFDTEKTSVPEVEPIFPASKSEGGAATRRTGVRSILTSFEKPKSDIVESPLERRKDRQSPLSSGRDFQSQAMRLVQNHSPQSSNVRQGSPQADVRAQIKRRVSENRKKISSSPLATPPKATHEFSDVRSQLRPVRNSPLATTAEVDQRETQVQKASYQQGAQQNNCSPLYERRSPQAQAYSSQPAVANTRNVSPVKHTLPDQQRSFISSPQTVREQSQKTPLHDVRAQIEKRVAAVSNRNKFEPPGHVEESSSSSDDLASAKNNLRSVNRKDGKHASPKQPFRQEYVMRDPSVPSHHDQTEHSAARQNPQFDCVDTFPSTQQRESPQTRPQQISDNRDDPGLTMPTDSEESDPDLIQRGGSNAGAAISRSLLMKQIQKPIVFTAPSPNAHSMGPADNKLNFESGSDVVTDTTTTTTDDNYAKTPKATMMMLNAFLAGRESVASADGAPSTANDGPGSASRAVVSSSKAKSSGLPALKDDPQYERYFKMLKIGMPMDVVKHAMTRDGVDPSVMDGDHNKPVGIPLKDDPEYSKYFKMLSIGLPMEAIKHSMARDGLDPSVMDQDHDMPAMGKKNQVEQPKEQDSHRRARLHWKTLRKVTSNSLWAQIDKETNFDIEIDEDEFQELFQAEKTVPKRQDASRSSANKKAASVCVIDSKRANNGGIILARLKMSHDDMADAVDRIDEGAMTAEQIEQIIEYLPSKEERKALESYMLEGGQDAAEKFDALCECEKFMVSMMTVKHAKRKVSAILFKLQFETCIRDIQKEAQLIEKACCELRNSSRLRQLLGIVLTFGNRLNTAGNGKRKAGAFTLDSLLKLREAKAFDKKTTFLHYIVMIVRRNNVSLLDFKNDIPTVFEGDKIFWDQCVADLEKVENQLENVRKIALYQAHQSNAFRLRRRNKKEDPDESLTDDDLEMTLEEELETLRATHIGVFTLSAIKYVSALRENVESTKIMFSRLLEYFGEEESAIQPHELFSTMVAFSRDFEKAKEEVFERENKRLREERKQEKYRTPVKSPPLKLPPQQRSPMLHASNLQPSMGSVLKQLKTSVLPLRQSNYDGIADNKPVQAPSRQAEDSRQLDRHYDTSVCQPAVPPQQTTESQSHTSRFASPSREDQTTRSKPQTTPKSPRSPHSTTITMSAMRAKTRLRRHLTPTKGVPIASPITPSRLDSPTSRRNRASAAAPYDAGAEQPLSPRSPRDPAPLALRVDEVLPRSSSALRMKRRMQHRVRMRNAS